MVDTISRIPSTFPNLGHACKKYPEPKSTTEPDNGHKSEIVAKLDYREELDRLQSFTGWPSDVVTPEALAKAGFYYLNHPTNRDLVKCAFCKAEICRWEQGDDAWDEHVKWSPNCSFILERTQNRGSIPFRGNSESGRDVCGNAEIMENSLPESEAFRLLSNIMNVKKFEDEKNRLASYVNWPKSLKQTPEVMAAAGFYYRGCEDHTICFECDGALKDWKDEDDPWEQHALWFPRCKHVLSKKGKEYVDEVQKKFKSSVSNYEAKENECEKSDSEEKVLCKICDNNERNTIFLPCKHILACDECSEQFTNCPVCRGRIDQKMKVFIS